MQAYRQGVESMQAQHAKLQQIELQLGSGLKIIKTYQTSNRVKNSAEPAIYLIKILACSQRISLCLFGESAQVRLITTFRGMLLAS